MAISPPFWMNDFTKSSALVSSTSSISSRMASTSSSSTSLRSATSVSTTSSVVVSSWVDLRGCFCSWAMSPTLSRKRSAARDALGSGSWTLRSRTPDRLAPPARCARRSTSATRCSRRAPPMTPSGLTVALAREIAGRLGVEVALQSYGAAHDSVAAVVEGRADVGFLAIDPGRPLAFTAPYVLIEGVYVVADDSPITAADRRRRRRAGRRQGGLGVRPAPDPDPRRATWSAGRRASTRTSTGGSTSAPGSASR